MVKFTILYNNISSDASMQTDWGMSCLVELPGHTILFDAGSDGRVLLSNMKKLNKQPGDVDMVVLSHIHEDHVGGFEDFLNVNSDIQVYLPASFPHSFRRKVHKAGAQVAAIDDPKKILENVHVTGEMESTINEQALIVQTSEGLVLVTGCSHPGVADMAARAADICQNQPLQVITGGFHLPGSSREDIADIINTFRKLGVKKVGPSHCTGEEAMNMFREDWGDDFLELGCGAHFEYPANSG